MDNPPQTLYDMIATNDYRVYESESTMSLQHRIINLPACVVDIVTHQDIIDTWMSYLGDNLSAWISDEVYDKIMAEIEATETWHVEEHTINDVVHDFSEVN